MSPSMQCCVNASGVTQEHQCCSLWTSCLLRSLTCVYTQNLTASIPPLLPHNLYFGTDFNQPVDNLPPNLKHLEFSDSFNPVKHLPHGLTHVTFGMKFNCSVDHLPSSLLHLHFGIYFNHPLDHLPPSLMELRFPEYSPIFNHSLELLPSTITSLNIPFSFNQTINKLPHSLTSLEIYDSSRIPIHPDINLAIPVWPPALQQLKLRVFSTEGFENLPSTLQSLEIICNKNHKNWTPPLVPYLPLSLKHLVVSSPPPNCTDWTTFSSLKSLFQLSIGQPPPTEYQPPGVILPPVTRTFGNLFIHYVDLSCSLLQLHFTVQPPPESSPPTLLIFR